MSNNYQTAPQTEPMALVSMILGIVGILFVLSMCLPIFSIPAVILGHLSRAKLRREPEYTGDGMALAGLICGYIGICISVLGILIYILFFAAVFGAAAAAEATIFFI